MRARTAKADEARTEAVHHARADQVVAAATTAVTVNREAVEAGRLPGAVDAPGVRRLVRCFWGGCCRLGNSRVAVFLPAPALWRHARTTNRLFYVISSLYAVIMRVSSTVIHLPTTCP